MQEPGEASGELGREAGALRPRAVGVLAQAPEGGPKNQETVMGGVGVHKVLS